MQYQDPILAWLFSLFQLVVWEEKEKTRKKSYPSDCLRMELWFLSKEMFAITSYCDRNHRNLYYSFGLDKICSKWKIKKLTLRFQSSNLFLSEHPTVYNKLSPEIQHRLADKLYLWWNDHLCFVYDCPLLTIHSRFSDILRIYQPD